MRLVRGLLNAHPQPHGAVVTIGNFDGVHRGHQALVMRAREQALLLGADTAVLSFEPTPREYFCPAEAPGRIDTLRGKRATLAALGVDHLVLQRFGRHFAAWSPDDFVRDGLVGHLGIRGLVVGDDFRFGAQRSGDLHLLHDLGDRHGFFVESVPAVEADGQRCSSTAVRAALAATDLGQAERLLGRRYTLTGRVRGGLQLGRKLGMPTANIVLRRRPALRLGVYVVTARGTGGTSVPARAWQGVASIGVRPTLGLTQCLLETHVFDDQPDLYGVELQVEFQHFLRPELRFESVEALAAQMQRDKQDAMAFFRSATDN